MNEKPLQVQLNFSPLQQRYTLEEFWALPERGDRVRFNLIGGLLFMVLPPDPPHGYVVSRMGMALTLFLIRNNISGLVNHPPEPICDSKSSTYLEPDIMYVSEGLRKAMGPIKTSADIVIECLTESTAVYDRTTKADTYLALGVGELWLIDPVTLTIEVRHPKEVRDTRVWEIFRYSKGEHAKSRVLEGWEVFVDEIFQDVE